MTAFPVGVAVPMTFPPQVRPAEDAQTSAPKGPALGFGLYPSALDTLNTEQLAFLHGQALCKLSKNASRGENPGRHVSQNLGKTQGLGQQWERSHGTLTPWQCLQPSPHSLNPGHIPWR